MGCSERVADDNEASAVVEPRLDRDICDELDNPGKNIGRAENAAAGLACRCEIQAVTSRLADSIRNECS